MAWTLEEAKQAIVAHLERCVLSEDRFDFRAYTLQAIMGSTGIESQELASKALDKLENDEDLVRASWLRTRVYLPDDKAGKEVRDHLVRRGVLVAGPFMSVFAGIALVLVVTFLWPIGSPSHDKPGAAYVEGIQNGVIWALFFGMTAGYIIFLASNWFIRWQAMRPEAYRLAARILVPGTLLTVVLMVAYIGIVRFFAAQVEQGVLVALLALAFTLAASLALWQVRHRPG